MAGAYVAKVAQKAFVEVGSQINPNQTDDEMIDNAITNSENSVRQTINVPRGVPNLSAAQRQAVALRAKNEANKVPEHLRSLVAPPTDQKTPEGRRIKMHQILQPTDPTTDFTGKLLATDPPVDEFIKLSDNMTFKSFNLATDSEAVDIDVKTISEFITENSFQQWPLSYWTSMTSNAQLYRHYGLFFKDKLVGYFGFILYPLSKTQGSATTLAQLIWWVMHEQYRGKNMGRMALQLALIELHKKKIQCGYTNSGIPTEQGGLEMQLCFRPLQADFLAKHGYQMTFVNTKQHYRTRANLHYRVPEPKMYSIQAGVTKKLYTTLAKNNDSGPDRDNFYLPWEPRLLQIYDCYTITDIKDHNKIKAICGLVPNQFPSKGDDDIKNVMINTVAISWLIPAEPEINMLELYRTVATYLMQQGCKWFPAGRVAGMYIWSPITSTSIKTDPKTNKIISTPNIQDKEVLDAFKVHFIGVQSVNFWNIGYNIRAINWFGPNWPRLSQ